MTRNLKTYLFFTVLAVSGVLSSRSAFAGKAALIEMFGSTYKCQANGQVEKEIQQLIEDNQDLVLINCRLKNPPNIPEIELYSHEFCNDGRLGYYKALDTMIIPTPMVVVNGRYDANLTKIDAALKASYSLDQIKSINLVRYGGVLEVSMPDAPSETGAGEVYLYSYLLNPEAMDVETPEPEKIEGDTYIGTAAKIIPFRPVVSMQKIADWSGGSFSLSYPITSLPVTAGYSPEQLGYVAVLHEGGSSGPVLAVGDLNEGAAFADEAKSQSASLPKSLPPGDNANTPVSDGAVATPPDQ
ncbi:MAG: hypothetical protein KDI61_05505 [Alphaproteobacteria bacterium]|nr:hypothetical protein [Alphaproteobacteria bacterium]